MSCVVIRLSSQKNLRRLVIVLRRARHELQAGSPVEVAGVEQHRRHMDTSLSLFQ